MQIIIRKQEHPSIPTIMAGVKRKEASTFVSSEGNTKKKPRKDKEAPKNYAKNYEETATDSDPIVESDTAPQSGEDDGVSWPSDGEDYKEDWAGVEDNGAGGVKVAAETANAAPKPLASKNTNTGTQGCNSS